MSQNGSFPQVGGETKMKFEHYVSRKNRQWPEGSVREWIYHGNLRYRPQKLPTRINKAILRDY